jgi:hypothetical protein
VQGFGLGGFGVGLVFNAPIWPGTGILPVTCVTAKAESRDGRHAKATDAAADPPAMNRGLHSADNYEKGIVQTAFDRRLK